jgi:hypothetical protein
LSFCRLYHRHAVLCSFRAVSAPKIGFPIPPGGIWDNYSTFSGARQMGSLCWQGWPLPALEGGCAQSWAICSPSSKPAIVSCPSLCWPFQARAPGPTD